MTLVERAQEIRARLMNPPNAVDDEPIDLKRKAARRAPIQLKISPIKPYLGARKQPAVEDVTRVVCEHYGVSPGTIEGRAHTYAIVRPRQMWAYLAKTELGMPYPQIGRHLGGRDHSTQVHAVQKITELSGRDPVVGAEVEKLKNALTRVFMIRNAYQCLDPREF